MDPYGSPGKSMPSNSANEEPVSSADQTNSVPAPLPPPGIMAPPTVDETLGEMYYRYDSLLRRLAGVEVRCDALQAQIDRMKQGRE